MPKKYGRIPTDVAECRIYEIAGLMAKGHWFSSWEQREEYALKWGCTQQNVREYANKAHLLIAFDPEDRKQLQQMLAQRCWELYEDARTRTSKMTNLPDYRSALHALELFAKLAGIDISAGLAPPPTARPVIQIICQDEAPLLDAPGEPVADNEVASDEQSS